jgi:uncharacterized protein
VAGILDAGSALFRDRRPHLLAMTTETRPTIQFTDIESDAKATGFDFPGTFEVTAFGDRAPHLVATVLSELTACGVTPDPGSVRQRESAGGKYLAVTVSFHCESRPLYEQAYERLRAHPAVRMTL